MDLIAPLSVEDIRAILKADPAAVYRTARASTLTKDGFVEHAIPITNHDLISIFESVASDTELVVGILEVARVNTIEIANGALSSPRMFPYNNEIMAHFGKIGGAIPIVVSLAITSEIRSFIVHRFGNKVI